MNQGSSKRKRYTPKKRIKTRIDLEFDELGLAFKNLCPRRPKEKKQEEYQFN